MMSRNLTRSVLVGILGLWLLFPLTMRDQVSEDAAAFAGAAHVFVHGKGELAYPLPDDRLAPEMLRAECGYDCNGGIPFVSAPPALVMVAPLGWLSLQTAEFVVRLMDAACLAGAFLVLWRRFDSPASKELVVATALASTPLVYETIQLGQVTPFLVLAVAVPFAALERRAVAVAVGVLVGVVTAFKVFPVVLLVAAYLLGRRLVAVSAVAVIASTSLVAVVVAPHSPTAFLDGLRVWNNHVSAASATASFMSVGRSFTSDPVPLIAQVLVVGVAIALVRRARHTPETTWVVVAVGAVLLWPQVWDHYLLVATVSMLAFAARPGVSRALPLVVAVATIPPAVAWWSLPTVPASNQATSVALVIAAICAWIAARRPDESTTVAQPRVIVETTTSDDLASVAPSTA